MPRYIAFLRAINAGPGRTVKMEPIRRAFDSLGFSGVETFMATGNVVFETASTDAHALELSIDHVTRQILPFDASAFIRTPEELAKIADYDAFSPDMVDTWDELLVLFFHEELAEEARRAFETWHKAETDMFHVRGREVYWLRRRKPGKSEYESMYIDEKLSLTTTSRGMRTIRKLVEKYG